MGQPSTLSGRVRLGDGWLALLGGGEFSFGETVEMDRVWLERAAPGDVAFVPAASGSADYGAHFASYLDGAFARRVVSVPIYRPRDARRTRNVELLERAAVVYLGGGVAEHLITALDDSSALAALEARLAGGGGGVVAIAAAAQACGRMVRGLTGGRPLPGLGWLGEGVVETNFDPGHDRRLRRLLASSGAGWALGLPAGSMVVFGPGERVVVSGLAFLLEEEDGDLKILG